MIEKPHITFRPARQDDREEIFRFTEHTYEWGDYLPTVWDRWFEENNTELLVAVINRLPVAVLHLVMLNPDEAWLEGMRVNTEYRKIGIGTRLVGYGIKRASMKKAGEIRFITASDNTPIHRMAETLGFTKVASIVTASAAGIRSQTTVDTPLKSDLPYLLPFFDSSLVLHATSRLIGSGWRFRRFTPSFLAGKLDDGTVRYIHNSTEPAALAIVDRRHGLEIDFIDGQINSLETLIEGLRNEASALPEHSELRVLMPENELVQSKLIRTGLKLNNEVPYWIFEKIYRMPQA